MEYYDNISALFVEHLPEDADADDSENGRRHQLEGHSEREKDCGNDSEEVIHNVYVVAKWTGIGIAGIEQRITRPDGRPLTKREDLEDWEDEQE